MQSKFCRRAVFVLCIKHYDIEMCKLEPCELNKKHNMKEIVYHFQCSCLL